MSREFLTRTEDDEHDATMDALHGRENELASYDANIEGYTQQLAVMDEKLPKTWPNELEKFKGKSNEQIYVIGGSMEDMLLASKLNYRDRVRMLLFTEQAECRKSEAAYEHCKCCLPKDEAILASAMDRHCAKRAAQKAKNQ